MAGKGGIGEDLEGLAGRNQVTSFISGVVKDLACTWCAEFQPWFPSFNKKGFYITELSLST